MITPWTVYWVLQMDAIARAAFWLPVVGLIILIMIAFISQGQAFGEDIKRTVPNPEIDAHNETVVANNQEWRMKKHDTIETWRMYGWAKVALFLIGFVFSAQVFIPNTRTMAAVILVPAIANNQTARVEANELYTLAKQALTKAVGAESESAPEEKAEK